MPTPEETVTAFLAAWNAPRGFAQAVRASFLPDTVWENVGMTRTTGPDEALTTLPGVSDDSDHTIRVDMIAMATDGDRVLTERVDHVLGQDGETIMSVRVMGTFVVRDGKIAAWRDYFDTAAFAGQGAG